jgi:hypothetical protein
MRSARSRHAAGAEQSRSNDHWVVATDSGRALTKSVAATRCPSSVYVVFGRRSPTDIDLARPGTGVRRLMLHMAPPGVGWSVAAASDVDADGRDDFVVDANGYPES